MNRFKTSGRARRPRIRRQIRIVLIGLLGFSLLQYLNTGTISWPGNLLQKITGTVAEYAGRPEAGWQRARHQLEELGTAREGSPLPDFDLSGTVVRIADGDTVSILDDTNRQHKVRLYGIDTPERDQPYGRTSRAVLVGLVDEKTVGVVIVETDRYGREVGTLYRQGININLAMVAGGHAWWYQHYAPHERKLAESEQVARAQGLGLWAASHPIPPWEWRRGRRQADAR